MSPAQHPLSIRTRNFDNVVEAFEHHSRACARATGVASFLAEWRMRSFFRGLTARERAELVLRSVTRFGSICPAKGRSVTRVAA